MNPSQLYKAHDSDNNKTDDIIAVKFGVFELGIRMWRSEGGMTHIMGVVVGGMV